MQSEPLANWNGQEMPLSEVRVSVLDRAFLFGDAIYEMIRVYQGQPFLFEDHLQRLQKNLDKLRLRADCSEIESRIRSTLQHSGVLSGSIYIQVTRGVAPRTHHFPDPSTTPNILIYVKQLDHPYQLQREQGGRVLLIDEIRWKRCDIKSVNLLANCLGAEEAHAAGYDESVFVESDGTLVEGTHTSLFGVHQGAILTSPLGEGILPGITRRLVLRLAEQSQIPVVEHRLHRDRLRDLDELFLTATTVEIMPVIQVDQQVIGSGEPGRVVRALQAAYQQAINDECPPR